MKLTFLELEIWSILAFSLELEISNMTLFTTIQTWGIDTTDPGIRYEIMDDLTETEKDVILSQTTGLSGDQLTVGSKFTTVGSSEESEVLV